MFNVLFSFAPSETHYTNIQNAHRTLKKMSKMLDGGVVRCLLPVLKLTFHMHTQHVSHSVCASTVLYTMYSDRSNEKKNVQIQRT